MCFDIQTSLCGRILYSEISITLWKSTFGSINCFCKSDRAPKLKCVWFVVMDNILKGTAGYLGAGIQLFPYDISIITLLGSGISSSIQRF